MTTDFSNWLERVEGKFMGQPVDIPPHDAILWALRTTAGEVIYCDEQIKRLGESELFERPVKETESEEIYTRVIDAEVISRWVRLRDDAIERMAKYAKMALDVGIEERQIALAENQAHQLVSVITKVLTDLGHDLADPNTRNVIRLHLEEAARPAIESTAVDVT